MSYINPLSINYPTPFYFFTATILKWQDLLIDDKHKELVIDSLKFMHDSKRVVISGFVIMPNHIHLILYLNPSYSISYFKRDFLKFTAQNIKFNLQKSAPKKLENFKSTQSDRLYQIWERRPLATELYSEDVLKQKLDYIHKNPCRSSKLSVSRAEDYYWSSARYYLNGVNNFEFLVDYRDVDV